MAANLGIPLPGSPGTYSPSQMTSPHSEEEGPPPAPPSPPPAPPMRAEPALDPPSPMAAPSRIGPKAVLGKKGAKQRLQAFKANKLGNFSFGMTKTNLKLKHSHSNFDEDDKSHGGGRKSGRDTPAVTKMNIDSIMEEENLEKAKVMPNKFLEEKRKEMERAIGAMPIPKPMSPQVIERTLAQIDSITATGVDTFGFATASRPLVREKLPDQARDHQSSRRSRSRSGDRKRRRRRSRSRSPEPRRASRGVDTRGLKVMPPSWAALKAAKLSVSEADFHRIQRELVDSDTKKRLRTKLGLKITAVSAVDGLGALGSLERECERAHLQSMGQKGQERVVLSQNLEMEFPKQAVNTCHYKGGKNDPTISWSRHPRLDPIVQTRSEVLRGSTESETVIMKEILLRSQESQYGALAFVALTSESWFSREEHFLDLELGPSQFTKFLQCSSPTQTKRTQRSNDGEENDAERRVVKEKKTKRKPEDMPEDSEKEPPPEVVEKKKKSKRRRRQEEEAEDVVHESPPEEELKEFPSSEKDEEQEVVKKKKKKKSKAMSPEVDFETEDEIVSKKKKKKKKKKKASRRELGEAEPHSEEEAAGQLGFASKLMSMAGYREDTEARLLPEKKATPRTSVPDRIEESHLRQQHPNEEQQHQYRNSRHSPDRSRPHLPSDPPMDSRLTRGRKAGPRTPSPDLLPPSDPAEYSRSHKDFPDKRRSLEREMRKVASPMEPRPASSPHYRDEAADRDDSRRRAPGSPPRGYRSPRGRTPPLREQRRPNTPPPSRDRGTERSHRISPAPRERSGRASPPPPPLRERNGRMSPPAPRERSGRVSPPAPRERSVRTSPPDPRERSERVTPPAPRERSGRASPRPRERSGRVSPPAPRERCGRTSPPAPRERTGRVSPPAPRERSGRTSPPPRERTGRVSPPAPRERSGRVSPPAPRERSVRTSPPPRERTGRVSPPAPRERSGRVSPPAPRERSGRASPRPRERSGRVSPPATRERSGRTSPPATRERSGRTSPPPRERSGRVSPAPRDQSLRTSPSPRRPPSPGRRLPDSPLSPGRRPVSPGRRLPASPPSRRVPSSPPSRRVPTSPSRRPPSSPGRRGMSSPGRRVPTSPSRRAHPSPAKRGPASPGRRGPSSPGRRGPSSPGRRGPSSPSRRAPVSPNRRQPPSPIRRPRSSPGRRAPPSPGPRGQDYERRPPSPPYDRWGPDSPGRQYRAASPARRFPPSPRGGRDVPSRTPSPRHRGSPSPYGRPFRRTPSPTFYLHEGTEGGVYRSRDLPYRSSERPVPDSTISDAELLASHRAIPPMAMEGEPFPPLESPKRLSLDERLEKELGITIRDAEGPPKIDFSRPPPGYPPAMSRAPLIPPQAAVPIPATALPQPGAPFETTSVPTLLPTNMPSMVNPSEDNRLLRVGNMLQIVPNEKAVPSIPPTPPQPNIVPPPGSAPVDPAMNLNRKIEEMTKKKEAERRMRREQRAAERLQRDVPQPNGDLAEEQPEAVKKTSGKRILETLEKEEDQEAKEAQLLKEAMSSIPEIEEEEVSAKAVVLEEDDEDPQAMTLKAMKRIQKEKRKAEKVMYISLKPLTKKERKRQQRLLNMDGNNGSVVVAGDYGGDGGLGPEDEEEEEVFVKPDPVALPDASTCKSILMHFGSINKRAKKNLKYADGVLPGQGSPDQISEEEEEDDDDGKKSALAPENRRKKRKKIRVRIVRTRRLNEPLSDEDEPPPPPPPGSPPLHHTSYILKHFAWKQPRRPQDAKA